MSEKISGVELNLGQAEADNFLLKEKLSKLQKLVTRGEDEREAMRAQIDHAESRATRSDLKNKSLHGENHAAFDPLPLFVFH